MNYYIAFQGAVIKQIDDASSLSVAITNCVYDKNFYHAWLLTALHCLLNWFGTKCDSMLRKYVAILSTQKYVCIKYNLLVRDLQAVGTFWTFIYSILNFTSKAHSFNLPSNQ